MAVCVGLFEQMPHMSPCRIEGDVESLGRFLDFFSLDQLRGDAGLGGREPVEIFMTPPSAIVRRSGSVKKTATAG